MSVGSSRVTLSFSGTAPVNANGATAVIGTTPNVLDGYDSITVVTTVNGNTGGTLDLYLQWTPDGVTWIDWCHFQQVVAGSAAGTRVVAASRPTAQVSFVAVGTGLSPALASGTFVGGDWGIAMRLLAVSGGGTTAGGSVSTIITASRLAGLT